MKSLPLPRRHVLWITVAVLFCALIGGLAAPSADAAPLSAAPDFVLPDGNGTKHKLSQYRGKWVVLEWVNYDCPFVKKHYDASHQHMQRLQQTYTGKGVVWLSICSSAQGKQGYMTAAQALTRPRVLKARASAVLLDPSGAVGRRYGAKTTPEFRIIDPRGQIVYSGAVDDVRSTRAADVPGATNYVHAVLHNVLAGRAAPVSESQPYGCSIKYGPAPVAVNAVPDFTLHSARGQNRSLSQYRGKWVVLEWVNYDCPFVKKQYHASHKSMQRLQSHYASKGVVWLSICSSAPGKQGHMTAAQANRWLAALGARPAEVLLDPTGRVGRLYGAKTTPDMRIISPRGELVYSGAIDSKRSARPQDVATSRNYVRMVLDNVLAGRKAPVEETTPYGCSVKYGRR